MTIEGAVLTLIFIGLTILALIWDARYERAQRRAHRTIARWDGTDQAHRDVIGTGPGIARSRKPLSAQPRIIVRMAHPR